MCTDTASCQDQIFARLTLWREQAGTSQNWHPWDLIFNTYGTLLKIFLFYMFLKSVLKIWKFDTPFNQFKNSSSCDISFLLIEKGSDLVSKGPIGPITNGASLRSPTWPPGGSLMISILGALPQNALWCNWLRPIKRGQFRFANFAP